MSDPGHPTPRPEVPPLGALVPPPQRSKPARKSARCGLGDGSPRPHPPHPQPVRSTPRLHAPQDERSGVGERPTPVAPQPGKRRPPPGALVPPPRRAKPARKSAHCGVGDGSPRPHPRHPQPVGSGPRPHAPKDEQSGVGDRPTPDAPHPGKRRPPRAPSCRPLGAQSQLARARPVGLVTGPHARTPRTHSQWVVGPGRRPQITSGRGSKSARPRTPHTHTRGAPPRAASCRPHSAQSQLARARPVGLVTGPHARIPRTHSQWVVGPSRTPQRTSGRGWESARPWTPHAQASGAPPGRPRAAPTAPKASSLSISLSIIIKIPQFCHKIPCVLNTPQNPNHERDTTMNTAQSRSIPIMTCVIVIPLNTYYKNPEMQVVDELGSSFQDRMFIYTN